MTAWTPPEYWERGEAPSAKWNTQTVNNIKNLDERTDVLEGAPYTITGAKRAGSFSRNSSTYGDPDSGATGPAVTVTTGTSVILILGAGTSASNGEQGMSVAISGATTVAAGTYVLEAGLSAAASSYSVGRLFLITGLTPGSNTFTAKYRSSTGSGNFNDTELIVQTVA